ncbi:MAG TPA: PAS domain-containing sensor histidine kinase [Nitrosospira sp.]|nr:PAS domain-containing sensor histidine kinase [Nitrosospira sp.]
MAVPADHSPLHPLQEDFEDFFENSRCGFLTMNSRGEILRSNSRLAGWLGCATENLKGLRFSELLTIGGKIYCETHLFPLLRMQGFFEEVALELACQGDERLPVLVNAYERRDADSKPQFIRVTVFKATHRRLYEENLRYTRTIAETRLADEQAISVLREQFIAVLGHDLRNPLGAIMGGAELLVSSPLSERDTGLINMMRESAARMAELIDNILDFARGRMGGGMMLNRQPVLLEPVLRHVVDELRTAWPKRAIEAEFRLLDPVDCDSARLSQILSNLLANALTHGSPEGPVRVRAFLERDLFELSVTNSGRPIPPEALEKLFQPFTRQDASSSQNGLGLGLYIASEIARAHKGELTVSSNAEETCFTFRMPASG